MQTISYNSDNNVLRFSFPPNWETKLLSAVSITINDLNNTELLSDTVSLYTYGSIKTAVSRFSTTISLKTPYTVPIKPKDLILISGSLGEEIVVVKGYDSTTKTITTETALSRQYDVDNKVYLKHCEYILDTTDTDTFKDNLQLRITWTPTGTGIATDEIAQIKKTALQLANFEESFMVAYPRAYSALKDPSDRLTKLFKQAETRVYIDLLNSGLDYYAIKDQRLLEPVLNSCVAYLWSLNGDSQIEDERKALLTDYNFNLAQLKKLPIWTDNNSDGIQDSDEVEDHEHVFEIRW